MIALACGCFGFHNEVNCRSSGWCTNLPLLWIFNVCYKKAIIWSFMLQKKWLSKVCSPWREFWEPQKTKLISCPASSLPTGYILGTSLRKSPYNETPVKMWSNLLRLKNCFFFFLRWRLQKAFFSPKNTGCLGCAGISVNDIIPFCSCADESEWEKLDKGYVTLG